MPSPPETAYFPLAPDWLCEVVSPSTAALDRARKLAIYAREGVPNMWLVDPLARNLEVLRLSEGRWVIAAVHVGSETVKVDPFAEIVLRLERLWIPANT